MPSEQPIISVVMIFFNAVRFIDEAITSVTRQTSVNAWELVLVDDGSTDGSSEIARRWSETNQERIRYVEHPGHENRGMSSARNFGVSVARGQFINFLDSDDVMLPGTIDHFVGAFADHPDADLVIGRVITWISWTGKRNDASRDWIRGHPATVVRNEVVPPTRLFRGIYGTPKAWSVPAICGIAIRRDALDRIGGFDSSFRGMYEDQVIYSKIGLHLSCVLDDRVLALYRQHQWSACSLDGLTNHWNPWRANPKRQHFLSWLVAYVEPRFGEQSAEMHIARENAEWRESPIGGIVRLALSLASALTRQLPPSAGDVLRRLLRKKYRHHRTLDELIAATR